MYTTYGKVRGYCGHQHESVSAATRCLVDDQRRCQARGYSDREVVRTDGEPLSEAERDELWDSLDLAFAGEF